MAAGFGAIRGTDGGIDNSPLGTVTLQGSTVVDNVPNNCSDPNLSC